MSSGPTSSQPHRFTVTYLQMLSPPKERPGPLPEGFRCEAVEAPTIHFYRELFRRVGGRWDWRLRDLQTDAEVLETVTPPLGLMLVSYWQDAPAGFAELTLTDPRAIQLQYFGLIPELVGSGLGRHFLAWIVQYVWARDPAPARFWLHTCTTDSPRALPCYRRAGFEVYDERSFDEEQ